MWCISTIIFLFAITEFSQKEIGSGVLMLFSSIIFNPIGKRMLKEKAKVLPYWLCAVIAVVCFFAAAIMTPAVN